jgi:ribonucleotide reductase beta subunit family protein with ferritin-like domain
MIMEEIKLNERMMTIATTTPFYNKNLKNEIITYEELLACNNHHNNTIRGNKSNYKKKKGKKS